MMHAVHRTAIIAAGCIISGWASAESAAGGSSAVATSLATLAATWAALGGAGHLFHANGIDWVPRFAVLRDLAVAPWPPRYGAGADAMLLRAPPGYYLPVALLGQLAGLAWLDRLLLAWTWLGVALFFCANFGGRPARGLAAALVFAFASGHGFPLRRLSRRRAWRCRSRRNPAAASRRG